MSMTAVPISMRPGPAPIAPAPDGSQRRKGRRELPREVVHAEIRAVCPELLGGDGQLDGLEQRVGGRSRARRRGGGPVAGRPAPNRVRDDGESVQWPNDRNPMRFTRPILPSDRAWPLANARLVDDEDRPY